MNGTASSQNDADAQAPARHSGRWVAAAGVLLTLGCMGCSASISHAAGHHSSASNTASTVPTNTASGASTTTSPRTTASPSATAPAKHTSSAHGGGNGAASPSGGPQGDPSKFWISASDAKKIALAGSHPNLSVCQKLVTGTAKSSVAADGHQYWAVEVTCAQATGGSPTDISIVAPTGQDQGGSYIAAGPMTYQGYDLLVDDGWTISGSGLTVKYFQAPETVAVGQREHLFKQTDTLSTHGADKGAMIAAGTRAAS